MLHNKYICDNPIQVTHEGDLYTFTYLDCRQTSRQAIRSILNEYAYSYFCAEGLLSRVLGIYCGQIPFTFFGNSASILLIPGLGGDREIAFPAAFNNWDIAATIMRRGVRNYTITQTVDDYMPTTDQTFYVDAAGGNNANDGLTYETRKQSIGSALAAATGVPLILIVAGSYSTASVTKSCILAGYQGDQWQLDASRTINTSGITVGFRNFKANFRQAFTGASTAVFDSPVCESASSAAIRLEGASKAVIFNASGAGCVNDVLSYAGTAMALEVDCVLEDHGTTASDNISTGHNAARIVTIGGTYRDTYRVVHDVNDSRRLMFGTVANTSKAVEVEGDSFNIGAAASGTSDVRIWLYGVDARGGSLDDLYTATGGTIYVDNETLYVTTSTGATITPFDREYA